MSTNISLQEMAPVSRETEGRLRTICDLLQHWNRRINLVGAATLPQLWTRHVLDSAQLWSLAPPATRWLDIGSGAGFPGLVIATLAAELAPGLEVVLVESDERKAAFLTAAARAAGLTPKVHARRIEAIPPVGADIVSARALAPLPRLFSLAAPHVARGGTLLLPKGRSWRKELTDARALWQMESLICPSQTDPDAVILKIGALRPCPDSPPPVSLR